MRILGISETCDLGSLYRRLLAEQHEVFVSVSEPLAAGTMAGLVPRVSEWEDRLDWVREAGSDGLVLFESVGFGALQDKLRASGFNVIGGSAFGDRLESDRSWALGLLAAQGLRIAPVKEFASAADAIADLRGKPRRVVFKRNAAEGQTFLGSLDDGADILAFLSNLPPGSDRNLLLMDHVEGVETGIGAYFNGEHFLRPACIDWEHKHFFANNLGELTGEMGTVASYRSSDRLFEATLLPLEPMLRSAGHVGYVNLNTIINADGIWPLEFTCRFGYPGFAVLEPLQAFGWGDLFRAMIAREKIELETLSGFSLCVVLTTPPFPYSRKQIDAPIGLPVIVSDVEDEHIHLGEVGMLNGHLVTTGLYGWTAVVSGTGRSVEAAQADAYRRTSLVQSPNIRYRLDIGQRLIDGELEQLSSWNWLSPVPTQ